MGRPLTEFGRMKEPFISLISPPGSISNIIFNKGRDLSHFLLSKELIEELIQKENQKLIAVGTTSVRTLESLYWLGIKMMQYPNQQTYNLSQWEAYELDGQLEVLPKVNESLQAILNYLNTNNLSELRSETQILIGPGYQFQLINGMITNFHQPKSTLLLLISAYLGDTWKHIYDYALTHNFRFLSYGDSCLFLK